MIFTFITLMLFNFLVRKLQITETLILYLSCLRKNEKKPFKSRVDSKMAKMFDTACPKLALILIQMLKFMFSKKATKN